MTTPWAQICSESTIRKPAGALHCAYDLSWVRPEAVLWGTGSSCPCQDVPRLGTRDRTPRATHPNGPLAALQTGCLTMSLRPSRGSFSVAQLLFYSQSSSFAVTPRPLKSSSMTDRLSSASFGRTDIRMLPSDTRASTLAAQGGASQGQVGQEEEDGEAEALAQLGSAVWACEPVADRTRVV